MKNEDLDLVRGSGNGKGHDLSYGTIRRKKSFEKGTLCRTSNSLVLHPG